MKVLFLFTLLPILCLKANAVELQNTDELEKLFKRYADSTLIFRGAIPMADAPENLFIISKKGDTVSLKMFDRNNLLSIMFITAKPIIFLQKVCQTL